MKRSTFLQSTLGLLLVPLLPKREATLERSVFPDAPVHTQTAWEHESYADLTLAELTGPSSNTTYQIWTRSQGWDGSWSSWSPAGEAPSISET